MYGREGGERNGDVMDKATQKALTMPLDEPQWLTPVATYRAFMVCLQLYQARRYDTCASLCDSIIVFRKNPPRYWTRNAGGRSGGLSRSSTKRQRLPAINRTPKTPYGLMKWDPFGDIDVPRLIVHPSKPPAP